MNVLVIGSGGREHAICYKLKMSEHVGKIYCAPGNGGIADIAECIDIKSDDISALLDFAKEKKIDLTVVGPEAPLSLGIVDTFNAAGMRIFGPNKAASMLEGSKAYSKDFMQRNNIPTAKYKNYDDMDLAISEIDTFGYPVVIKADGLASGKGVIIANDRDEGVEAISDIMGQKKFGEAGNRVVVEEFLQGYEVSILAFVDGKIAVPMVSAKDYKRAKDGDLGLNTGGMGAVSPAFYYSDEISKLVKTEIIDKTVEALNKEGIEYKGVLYFGLMLTKEGPKVLEYNARFGDPETEVVLMRLNTDLFEIMNACIDGELSEIFIHWKDESAVCVVMASQGYPEEYKRGYEITKLPKYRDDLAVFHAGTELIDTKLYTAGGRVLVASALGVDIEDARVKAYEAVKSIEFSNKYYRTDIGKR